MGLIAGLLEALFGGGRNALRETAEVFRPNAEAEAQRAAAARAAALAQFAGEFAQPERGLFDRLVDGLNRLPRPAMAFGTLALFIAAMWRPEWFAARMAGLALVPEPLWWLLGVIVSFYFGARHQVKGQEFQARLAAQAAALHRLSEGKRETPAEAPAPQPVALQGPEAPNAALEEWRRLRSAAPAG